MFYGSTVEHRQGSTISDLHESRHVNKSLEELKNIKPIPFLIQEPVQIAKFPEISHFLTNLAVM